jgi:hypothetical protein
MASSSSLAGPSQNDAPDAQSLGVAENSRAAAEDWPSLLRRCAEHGIAALTLDLEHESVEAELAAIDAARNAHGRRPRRYGASAPCGIAPRTSHRPSPARDAAERAPLTGAPAPSNQVRGSTHPEHKADRARGPTPFACARRAVMSAGTSRDRPLCAMPARSKQSSSARDHEKEKSAQTDADRSPACSSRCPPAWVTVVRCPAQQRLPLHRFSRDADPRAFARLLLRPATAIAPQLHVRGASEDHGTCQAASKTRGATRPLCGEQ